MYFSTWKIIMIPVIGAINISHNTNRKSTTENQSKIVRMLQVEGSFAWTLMKLLLKNVVNIRRMIIYMLMWSAEIVFYLFQLCFSFLSVFRSFASPRLFVFSFFVFFLLSSHCRPFILFGLRQTISFDVYANEANKKQMISRIKNKRLQNNFNWTRRAKPIDDE